MRRIAALLAFAVLAVAAQAQASVAIDMLTEPAHPGWPPRTMAPAFAGDGSVIFGVERSASGVLDEYRLAPGATELQPLEPFGLPPIGRFAIEPYGTPEILPAGNGYVAQTFQEAGQCCTATWHDSSLVLHPDAAGPGTTLHSVPASGRYNDCALLPATMAGDAGALLLVPKCDPRSAVDPVVRDHATGEETTIDRLWTQSARLAGDYAGGAAGPDDRRPTIINWRTGETIRRLPALDEYALLPDGTVLYSDPSGNTISRLRPGETEPTTLVGVRGTVTAAAAGNVLSYDGGPQDRTVHVFSAEGKPLDHLLHVAAVGFDGTHVAFLETSCMKVRLHVWDVGTPDPERLPPQCDRPAITGPVAIGPRAARLPLRCPTTRNTGCMGRLTLLAPRAGRFWEFALEPGEAGNAKLLGGLSRRRCLELVQQPRWRVRVEIWTVYGFQAQTRRVARSAVCG